MQHNAGNAESAPTGAESPNAGPAVLRLCRGVRRGDRAAFTALYDAWYGRWMREARAVLGRDDALCADIVQDAFVRVIRGMPELSSEAALAAWMGRVLRSSAVDVLRRESRRRARERGRLVREEGALSTAEDVAWMTAALATLEAEDAALLRARVVDGLTLEEAGRAAGISGDAAHGRVRRALARLRVLWEKTHE